MFFSRYFTCCHIVEIGVILLFARAGTAYPALYALLLADTKVASLTFNSRQQLCEYFAASKWPLKHEHRTQWIK